MPRINPELAEYRIPEEIVKEKNVADLSDFAARQYGKPVDKRLGWEKAHKLVINMRRQAVRALEQQERNEVMDKIKWPWKDGFKFYCDGPNPTVSNACYVTDISRGVQLHISEDRLASYLEENFELPAPAPFVHESQEIAKAKAKAEAQAAEAARVKAEAEAKAKLEADNAAKLAAKEEQRAKAMSEPALKEASE